MVKFRRPRGEASFESQSKEWDNLKSFKHAVQGCIPSLCDYLGVTVYRGFVLVFADFLSEVTFVLSYLLVTPPMCTRKQSLKFDLRIFVLTCGKLAYILMQKLSF